MKNKELKMKSTSEINRKNRFVKRLAIISKSTNFAAFSLLCVLVFSGQIFAQRNARTADALFKEGQTLYAKDDADSLELAASKFEEARQIRVNLRDRQGEAVASVFLGRVYTKLNNGQEAVKHYLAAIAIFRQLNDRTGEAAVLNNVAALLRNNGEYNEAIKYYQTSIPLLRQFGNKTDVAKALNGIGQTYLAMGNYPSALTNLEESLEIWNTITKGDDDKIRAIYNLAIAHYRLGNKSQTLNYANQSLSFARQRSNPALEVEVLESLAQIYDETGDLKTAVDYRKKALETYQRAGRGRVSDNSLDTVTNNLGDLYYRMGDLTLAEKLLLPSIRNGVSGRNNPAQSFIYGTLGEIYMARSDYPKALQYLNKSIEIAAQANHKHSEAYSLTNVGYVYLNQSNGAQAVDAFNRALSFFQAGANPDVEARALSGLIIAYAFAGNQNMAKQAVERAERGNLDKGNLTATARLLYAVGLANLRFNQTSQAVSKLEQALQIAAGRGNMIESSYVISALGTAYAQSGNHSKALEFHERAVKIWQTLGNRSAEISSLDGAGWANLNLNKLSEATNFGQQVLRSVDAIAEQNSQTYYRVSALHLLGKSAAKSKDAPTAVNYYNQALSLAQSSGNAQLQKHFLNDIADAFEAAGDKKQAKNYRSQAKKIKD